MTWELALAVAAALFGVFIVWRVRPVFGARRVAPERRKAFADARARVALAKTPAERALALCDAGDARAGLGGSPAAALGYYLRAIRTEPSSVVPIERAARTLARRPHLLESFLWRRLGSTPWEREYRAAAIAALRELERLYSAARRNRSRASAVRHALAALGEAPAGHERSRSSVRPPRAAPVNQG
jgi:hypothetical protein